MDISDIRICMLETSEGWAVWIGNQSKNYYEPNEGGVVFEKLSEASNHAKELKAKYPTMLSNAEIVVVSMQEQELALIEKAIDVTTRLKNLKTYHTQFPVDHSLNVS